MTVVGDLVYVSGQIPTAEDGSLMTGKVRRSLAGRTVCAACQAFATTGLAQAGLCACATKAVKPATFEFILGLRSATTQQKARLI